jgi:hypothetical protein
MWRLYVLPALGDRLVHEITSEQIQDLHVAMVETRFAANRVLALLPKAFNLAELWGWRERGSNRRGASGATRSPLTVAT